MSYPHFQITVPLLETATAGTDYLLSANGTGDRGDWPAGPMRYIVRRVAIQRNTTGAGSIVVSFRTACGGAASATGKQFAKITTGATGVREDGMFFNDGFTPQVLNAGYRIVANVTTASTGMSFRAWAMIEPNYERLQNLGTGAFISVTA